MKQLDLRKWRLGLMLTSILLCALIVTAWNHGVLAMGFGERAAKLVVYGQRIEGVPGPVLFEARTYVPIKAIEGPLGLAVQWDTATKTLYINSGLRDQTVLTSPLPYKDYETANLVINGETIIPSAPPIIYEGMVYLPVRELAALGLEV
ncbi:MAG: stalk domain-containing protein, partial [Bacillota bacterium]